MVLEAEEREVTRWRAVHGDPPYASSIAPNELLATVLGARALAADDAAAQSCALVEVVGEASVVKAPRTRARGGAAPAWGEAVEPLAVSDAFAMLRVSVLDPQAKGKGATRGYCQMPLSSLASQIPWRGWVALGDGAGEVEMWLWWRHNPQLRGNRDALAKRADAAEAAEEDRAATKLQTIQRGRHARNSPPKPGATPAPGMLQRGKRERAFAVPSADDDERERKEREEATRKLQAISRGHAAKKEAAQKRIDRSRDVGVGAKVGRASPGTCLLYTSPSPRDRTRSRMPSSA